MRVTLIHNPDAGDTQHSAKQLLEELTKAGYDAHLHSTKKTGTKKALADPGDLVVVAGGDGSIKKVALALAGRGVPLAILPIGTANNIAKSLGAIGPVPELIASWRRAERRRLTVGAITSRWGSMRFVESVGVGVLTELVARGRSEVHEGGSGLTGHAIDRALQLLQRIVEEHAPRFRRLELDGTDASGDYLLVEVMNMPLVGPNIPLAPEADYGDEQLDIVTVTEGERRVLAEYVKARLSGGAAPPQLTTRRASRVQMRASPSELHVDDEAWRPDTADKNPPGLSLDEGEMTIALDGAAVEVLVGR